MNNYKEIFSSIHLNDDRNIEIALKALKENGVTQIDCVKILISELAISLTKADEIVVNSITWSSHKIITEKFRNEFGDFLESIKTTD